MRSWLWLERSGLAPESGRARLRQLEKGIMEKGAKREGIMAIVGKVCGITPPLKNHVLVIWSVFWVLVLMDDLRDIPGLLPAHA